MKRIVAIPHIECEKYIQELKSHNIKLQSILDNENNNKVKNKTITESIKLMIDMIQ